jgi:hypothetical protein
VYRKYNYVFLKFYAPEEKLGVTFISLITIKFLNSRREILHTHLSNLNAVIKQQYCRGLPPTPRTLGTLEARGRRLGNFHSRFSLPCA